MFSVFSGGPHEEHQQHSSALPLHAARPLPQLHQVSSGGHPPAACITTLLMLNNASSTVTSLLRFRIEQPVYINIIRDPINRFLSNYFFRRFGDWRGEQNHLIRTPGMKDDERYLVRIFFFFFGLEFCDWFGSTVNFAPGVTHASFSARIWKTDSWPVDAVMTLLFLTLAEWLMDGWSFSSLGPRSFTFSACLSPSSVSLAATLIVAHREVWDWWARISAGKIKTTFRKTLVASWLSLFFLAPGWDREPVCVFSLLQGSRGKEEESFLLTEA